jgi:plasmid stabilization system protein ParE
MSGYAFHPEAFADIDEIWEYIAKDNIDAESNHLPYAVNRRVAGSNPA